MGAYLEANAGTEPRFRQRINVVARTIAAFGARRRRQEPKGVAQWRISSGWARDVSLEL